MGLGMAPALARRVAFNSRPITVSGAAVGSATGLIGLQGCAYITASNVGSGACLPAPGGDVGALTGMMLGDSLTVFNLLSASVVIYAPGTMTFTGDGASTVGSVGISVASNRAAEFVLLTNSTYGVLKGMSA